MTHDMVAVAGYLAGELTSRDFAAFERHLLSCDTCWAEIETARRGQDLARRAHEPAPAGLVTRLHDAIAAASQTAHPAPTAEHGRSRERPRRRRRVLAVGAVLAAVVAVAIVAAVALGTATPTPTGPVAAAVTGYADNRLPDTTPPAGGAGPDLTGLGLAPAGAGAGRLAGQQVTAYAYRDPAGRRIFLYLSDRPFPMPADADRLGDETGAWTIRHYQIVVLCARTPHEVLIIGTDPDLVHTVATTLDLT